MADTRKRLLLLAGGPEQVTAVRIAKELGAYTIVFDGSEKPPVAAIADECHHVNIKDEQALLNMAKAVKPDAVFVHAAELAIEAGAVVTALGLPGQTHKSAIRGTDKAARSMALTSAGILMPRYMPLAGNAPFDDWQAALETIGLPAVAKPTRFAGAKGVKFLSALQDLEQYFLAKDAYAGQDFILEEQVRGLQLSTESVVRKGVCQHTNIALRHYDTTAHLMPHAIEDGHSMPYADDAKDRPAIEALMQKAAKALHIDHGVLKGDLVKTSDGQFVTLEMAVRTSGGRFADTVAPRATGVNILYPLIADVLGVPCPDAFFTRTETRGVSQRFLLIPEGTALTQAIPVEFLKSQSGVVDIVMRDDYLALGRAPAIQSHHDRLGYVICEGADSAEADTRAVDLIAQMTRILTGETP